MKALPRIDFIAASASPWLGRGLLALALALLAAVSYQAHLLRQSNRVILAETAAVRAARPIAGNLTEAQRRSLQQVRALASQITAPWSDLLAVFEQHIQPDVGLLRLEPDARSGRVRLSAEAKDTKAMMAYVTALEADVRLVEVVLMSHQLERDVAGQPVRFTVQAGWRPAPSVATTKARAS